MTKKTLLSRLTIVILLFLGLFALMSGCLPIKSEGTAPDIAGGSNGSPGQTVHLIFGAALIVLVIFLAVALRGKENR